MGKLSQEFVSNAFTEAGCQLLDHYTKNSTPMKYRCSCGNISTICWKSFRRGSRCLKCAGKEKKTIEFIKEEVSNRGYTLLSNEYINAFSELELMCSKGHIFISFWNNIQQNRGCPECGVEKIKNALKLDIEEVRKIFREKGCELLENTYKNNYQKLKYKC